MEFERAMPDAWRVFFRQRRPRPIQVTAMPALVRGQSALISSPTASGKSEAAFAPLYQRHVSFRRNALSTVYIAPTKALVNDMYERLLGYFGDRSDDTIQRYTGDHHDFKDPVGKFALVCTPEALDSLQLLHDEKLRFVRAIICDELHLLHGTARGQQLRSVVARLRAHAEVPKDHRDIFQIVAMTATVAGQEEVSRLWLGDDGVCIASGDPRKIDLTIVNADPERIIEKLSEALRNSDHEKILVFCNSRNTAHRLAVQMETANSSNLYSVYMHIGILGRAEREHIEASMKRDKKAICFATSTLEVGIDIGDVDLVALVDVPHNVSGFLQRIGRGNRRSERCVVWAFAKDEVQIRKYQALLYCAERGMIDDCHDYDRPSVQFQQALSHAWIGARRDSPLTYANLEKRTGGSVSKDVVEDMVRTGALLEMRGALVPSNKWLDVGDARRIHSVISGGSGVPLIDTRTGDVIASLGARTPMSGDFHTGTRVAVIRAQDDSGVYIAEGRRRSSLAKLPTARGRVSGLSRMLTWGSVLNDNRDPRTWVRLDSCLETFGGLQYNTLAIALLSKRFPALKLTADDFAIRGLLPEIKVTASLMLELASEFVRDASLPAKFMDTFRDSNPYFSSLSPEQQNLERRRSLPWAGFTSWLRECSATESPS